MTYLVFCQFVLAAQDVCTRLKVAGYWADFINPFSGRPNHTPLPGGTLYKTDERFRCLGFMIKKHADCKVISPNPNEKKAFVGKCDDFWKKKENFSHGNIKKILFLPKHIFFVLRKFIHYSSC